MRSAAPYANFIDGGPRQGHQIDGAEKTCIQMRDVFYQSNVSETGWHYV